MIAPTAAEVIAIKADARRRFGSDRSLSCLLTAPVDACVVVAPFDLKSYSAHVDSRSGNLITTQSGAVTDRVLWCSLTMPDAASSPAGVDMLAPSKEDPEPLRRTAIERLEAMRSVWPVVDAEIEAQLRKTAGATRGADVARAVQLTPGNAPPGLSAAEAATMLAGAPALGAGSLWSVSHSNGMALVLKAPRPNAWLAARAAWSEAHVRHAGIVDSALVLVRQLVEWSPEPFEAYLDGHPGYAEALWNPLLDMGGSSATTSAAFL